jgi:hypothetical protein
MIHPLLQDIAGVVYTIDFRCRRDLCTRTLNNEPQYVAALTTRIRDYLECLGVPALCHAQALPATQERLLGCDAALLFHLNEGIKVGLFEAKWPRLLTSRYSWDRAQGGTGVSHFTDQLSRQSRVASHVAVWELLMLEACPGQYHVGFDIWGATCLWHSEADAFNHTRSSPQAVWSQYDARGLARSVTRHRKNLGTCVRRLVECSVGSPVAMSGGAVPIATWEGESLGIPIDVVSFRDAAPAAARALGLSSILYADLRDLDILGARRGSPL